MIPDFESILAKYRQFLGENDYPTTILWVTADDVLLDFPRQFFVRLPIPAENEQRVRRIFEVEGAVKFGVVLSTITFTSDVTYACAWAPTDEIAASQGWANSGVRYSAKTDYSKIPARTVRNGLRWSYLKWKLKKWKKIKDSHFE